MRRWEDVGVCRDDEGRRLDAADLLREVEILLHRLADLAEQPGPVFGPGRDAGVQLIHRRLLHGLGRGGTDLALLRENLRIKRVAPERRRDHHELAHHLRVPDGGLQRHAAAERIAHDVGGCETQVLDQGGDVVGHQRDAQGAIDVGRAPMALQVDGDHLAALGERREVGAKHLDGAETAVQQDERSARAVALVVQLDAVHVGVMAGAIRLAPPGALCCALGRRLSTDRGHADRGDDQHCGHGAGKGDCSGRRTHSCLSSLRVGLRRLEPRSTDTTNEVGPNRPC